MLSNRSMAFVRMARFHRVISHPVTSLSFSLAVGGWFQGDILDHPLALARSTGLNEITAPITRCTRMAMTLSIKTPSKGHGHRRWVYPIGAPRRNPNQGVIIGRRR